MATLPALFAMRTAIGVILVVAAAGLVLGGIGRVISDAVGWYKDHMMDPYRDLRKKSKGTRRVRKTLEEIVNDTDATRRVRSNDEDNPTRNASDSRDA